MSDETGRQPIRVDRLETAGLRARLDRGERLALLDVREPAERDHCRIATPIGVVDLHVPIGEVVARGDAIRSASAGLPIVVYCHHGVRSLAAAGWLAGEGFEGVSNLEGGIDAWSRRVDPSVRRY